MASVALANTDFDTAGASAGLASGWTQSVVSSVESYPDFSGGGDPLLPEEAFQTGWAGDPYLHTLASGDVTLSDFGSGSLASPEETFETQWGTNENYATTVASATGAEFGFEGDGEDGFERGWALLAVTADHTTDLFSATNHALGRGRSVRVGVVGTGVPPAAFDETTVYQIVVASAHTVQLEPLGGGGAITFADNGDSPLYLELVYMTELDDTTASTSQEDDFESWPAGYLTTLGGGDVTLATFDGGSQSVEDFEEVLERRYVTMQSGSTSVLCAAHPYSVNDVIQWEGPGIPGGFQAGVDYHVKTIATNSLVLSLTAGGAAITATSDSLTGTASVFGTPTLYWFDVE